MKYPANESKDYFGRGPIKMHGSTMYGGFGEAFGPIGYKRFIDDPDGVIENDYVAFSSAIYQYMTPDVFKPSMHDIMTGFW